jgi:hypothetical protein
MRGWPAMSKALAARPRAIDRQDSCASKGLAFHVEGAGCEATSMKGQPPLGVLESWRRVSGRSAGVPLCAQPGMLSVCLSVYLPFRPTPGPCASPAPCEAGSRWQCLHSVAEPGPHAVVAGGVLGGADGRLVPGRHRGPAVLLQRHPVHGRPRDQPPPAGPPLDVLPRPGHLLAAGGDGR